MMIWDKKCKKVNNYVNYGEMDDYGQLIDDLPDFMAKSIRAATRTTVGITTITNNCKPWMTREITDLIEIKNKYRRKFEKRRKKGDYNCELKSAYNKLDKLRKRLIKLSKKKFNYEIGRTMCSNIDDAKALYGEYSKVLEGKKDLPPFKRDDGSYTDDTIEKANMMHNQFTKDHEENKYSDDAKRFHVMVDELISNMIENDSINDYDEIDDTIKYLEIINRN